MKALERLGLEVVAYTLIGSRTSASVLMTLLDGGGASVSWSAISVSKPWRMSRDLVDSANVAKTRICLLRERMDDLGLGGAITTVGGFGYAIHEPFRGQIIDRLLEEASRA